MKIKQTLNFAQKIHTKCSEKFEQQFKYLCEKIKTTEWSGVLFYSIEGEFPNITKIILEEIFLMDIGNAAYTEYSFNDKIIDFRMNNPHTLNYKLGHIHSHAGMSVFFSGTDSQELEDNIANHTYYLSVIVNNHSDICGKLAILSKRKKDNIFPIVKEDGSIISVKINTEEEENTLLIYDCDFQDDNNKYNLIDKEFIDSLIEDINIDKIQIKANNFNEGRSWIKEDLLDNPYQQGSFEDFEESDTIANISNFKNENENVIINNYHMQKYILYCLTDYYVYNFEMQILNANLKELKSFISKFDKNLNFYWKLEKTSPNYIIERNKVYEACIQMLKEDTVNIRESKNHEYLIKALIKKK